VRGEQTRVGVSADCYCIAELIDNSQADSLLWHERQTGLRTESRETARV
jgi:hypothetical protein